MEERYFIAYQSLYSFDTAHFRERFWANRVPATNYPSEHRQVFTSVGRDC